MKLFKVRVRMNINEKQIAWADFMLSHIDTPSIKDLVDILENVLMLSQQPHAVFQIRTMLERYAGRQLHIDTSNPKVTQWADKSGSLVIAQQVPVFSTLGIKWEF